MNIVDETNFILSSVGKIDAVMKAKSSKKPMTKVAMAKLSISSVDYSEGIVKFTDGIEFIINSLEKSVQVKNSTSAIFYDLVSKPLILHNVKVEKSSIQDKVEELKRLLV